MNQIPNIEEEDIVEALLEDVAVCLTTAKNCVKGSEKHFDFDRWREKLHQQLQKAREEEREACAVTVWSYLATFEDCLEPTQRTNALIQAIRLIRDRKTDHSELDQEVSK